VSDLRRSSPSGEDGNSNASVAGRPNGAQEPSPEVERDRERARHARLLKPHAPPDWEERFRRDDLLDAIIDGEPIQMFVMAADIRESTLLMKEAVKFERFAFVMDKFVTAVRRGLRRSGGWFDKFTGDGFLAYWIAQAAPEDEYHEQFVQATGNIVHTAHTLVDFFHRLVLEDFRSNSRNLPQGVGLSMGLDAGPGYLVQIAGELTVVGSPVVGAVRMVTAAEQPREIVANVFLGERLREEQDGVYEELGVTVTREYRPTKEYPKGQEVYALTFGGPDEADTVADTDEPPDAEPVDEASGKTFDPASDTEPST
jgi:class 3 adenylate cyclase